MWGRRLSLAPARAISWGQEERRRRVAEQFREDYEYTKEEEEGNLRGEEGDEGPYIVHLRVAAHHGLATISRAVD